MLGNWPYVARAVLDDPFYAAGAGLDNAVKLTVYLTDLDDYSEMNEAYAQYFEGIEPPSRVAMEISGLVGGALIEISFIAVKTDD